MAPIRRYLRITKYSVLEVRIYVDNPALTHTWLLNPRNPILPRVIESVRPLVLPKLREEKERALQRKKSSKKKGIKDVVVEDDFEVSIFLTETPTRHSLLTKHRQFRDKASGKLTSNSSKMISETNQNSEAPIDVDANDVSEPIILREDSDEDAPIKLDAIPSADDDTTQPRRRSKRQRDTVQDSDEDGSEDLFVASDEDDVSPIAVDSDTGTPPPKRQRKQKDPATDGALEAEDPDDKKKMALGISFEGFAIYGRVLCLVVKKREGATRSSGSTAKGGTSAAAGDTPGGQATMENWITSTQMPNPGAEEVEVS